MKQLPRKQILLGLIAMVAILTLLSVNAFHKREAFVNSRAPTIEQGVSGTALVTPAPPPPAPPLPVQPFPQARVPGQPNTPTGLPTEDRIFYDEKLSFEANLQRLKEFCRSHSSDQRLEQLLDSFLKVLFEHTKAHFPAIKAALVDLDGPIDYRNILLGCLMASDGSPSEKANIIWSLALDSREPPEVRRTASFLTGQIDDNQKRPSDLYNLLTDADSQVVLFALQGCARNLDQRDYDLIRTNLVNSSDIHLQVAAISAIGISRFADSQTILANILENVQTSKEDSLSEPSLLKRAAISYLDIHNPAVLQTVEHIALDESEDPGVRAKAIGRLTPTGFPGADAFLLELLNQVDANSSLPLRATIDALLIDPTLAHVQAIRQKLAQLPDAQLRDLLIKRVDAVTK